MKQGFLLPTLNTEQMETFSAWYVNYPKKQAKLDAMRAWLQTEALHPSLPEMVAILAQQKASQDWLRDAGQYIPLPASYLRAGRFLDELQVDLGANVNGKPWHKTWSGTVAKGAEFGLAPSQFAHPDEFAAAVNRAAKQKLERVA